MSGLDLSSWIARLFDHPGLHRMGHNQSAEDLNLGLGWLYYALGRLVHPRRAVVIGSYRGFVPLVIARALQDNVGPSELTFIDPSFVDDFWKDPARVTAWFEGFGLHNVRHHQMTTQEFVASHRHAAVGELGLLFVDGLHSAEQARYDHEAFADKLGPFGMTLFHDSMVRRDSTIYGRDNPYVMNVGDYIAELRKDARYHVFDVPYGTGLSLVRRLPTTPDKPLLTSIEDRPDR